MIKLIFGPPTAEALFLLFLALVQIAKRNCRFETLEFSLSSGLAVVAHLVAKMEGNKKKRKISELINIYEISKAPLPPPLDEPLPSPSEDSVVEGAPAKRQKLIEGDVDQVSLPTLPEDPQVNARKKLKSSNSRPKLSAMSTSERRLRERQRTEAANEILSSEKNYVAALESFVNVRPKGDASRSDLTVVSCLPLSLRFLPLLTVMLQYFSALLVLLLHSYYFTSSVACCARLTPGLRAFFVG